MRVDEAVCPTGNLHIATMRKLPVVLICRSQRCCRIPQISFTFAASRLDTRGASRSSRTLGAGCDGRVGEARRAALMRTAKLCGPDAPMLASSLRVNNPQATVAKEPGRRGERSISRRTVAQGRPDCFGEPVVDYARALFLFACEAAGAASTRLSLRPLFSRVIHAKPGRNHAAGSSRRVPPLSCPA
jgi:hypothetical protein